MLYVRGTTYHFRRIVPPTLRAALNQREIWVSLRTGYQNEARRRASRLHAQTTDLFTQTRLALCNGEGTDTLKRLRDQMRDLRVETPTTTTTPPPKSIPLPCRTPTKKATTPDKASPLLLSEALKRFVLDNPRTSADTKAATTRAVGLFLRAFGDAPVTIIGGDKAGAFRDLLFSLPAAIGKRKNDFSLEEEAQAAKAQNLPTLSSKSVKNHMMRLSALWTQLLQRELVTRNPWTGWNFEGGRKTVRRSWTPEELSLLSSTSWPSAIIPEQTFRLVTLIAAYSGMRLGEICALRRNDLQTIENVPCFLVRPHSQDGWSPKTEAGTRVVPIHSKLIDAGVLELIHADAPYLIPGLQTSRQGDRSTLFGRSFSTFKTRLGLPREITFHSFRHTVSTLLRNADANIREVWIDHLLGHEASHKSQGTTTYLTGITIANLRQTVEAIHYPRPLL